jgi:hypothetical protein
MANILIGHGNAVNTTTLAGGSWAAAYPLGNLKDGRLALVARTTSAASASSTITVDLGAAKAVRAVGLVAHNISAAGTFTVEGSTSSSFSPVGVTSGAVPAWPAGTVAADMAGMARPCAAVAVSGTYRYWRVTISDAGNAAGYIQLGRLFIGDGWQPSINYQSGATLGFETDTSFERSLGGAEFASVKPLRRVMRFGLPALPHAEAFGTGLEVIRRSATHNEVLVIPDSADAANLARRNFMGRIRQLSPVEQPFSGSATLGFEVSELL